MGQKQIQLCRGDIVKIQGQERLGEVVQLDHKRATVAFDTVKVNVPCNQLERVMVKNAHPRAVSTPAVTRVMNIDTQDYFYFNTAIDLHGMSASVALKAVERWIDRAALLGHKHLKIIHGKGTGTLRQAVRDYLQHHEQVKEMVQDSLLYRGGTGVTGVVLM